MDPKNWTTMNDTTTIKVNSDVFKNPDNWVTNISNISVVSADSLNKPKYKYAEDRIIAEFQNYIDRTYGEHYVSESQNLECFDAWIALGDSMPTFRNTALKYLWRYGKKNGSNKDDLMKVLHYTLMMLYVDHYKKGE